MGFHARLAQGVGGVGVDAVRRARSRSGAVPGAARRGARRHRALLHGDRRRHRRPGVRVQAADRPLRRAARRAGSWRRSAGTSASAIPTSCSCSTPSAATSARPPSTTPARRSAATAPTPSPSTRTSAPTPRRRSSPRGGVLALCHTSNAGSGELQDLDVGGRAAVRAGGDDGRRAVVRRSASAASSSARPIPAQLGAVRRHRRRPADPRARRRRPGRRPRGLGSRRVDRARHRPDRQLVAGRSSTPRPATTSPRPPARAAAPSPPRDADPCRRWT